MTVNEAVGFPRPMTIMPALLFTAEIPMFAPTSVLKAPVPPVTPIPAAGEGWEVVLVTRAYRMPGNGEAPIFWSRLQTPDSEKKRPARCAESQNCLSKQTLRFNKQSIYEGKHVGAVLAGLFMIRKRSIVQFASRSKSHYRGRYCTLRFT